jgi:hypothetical protein
MYNPVENEYTNEYIELLTDLNMSGFTIQDLVQEDTLEQIRISNTNYTIIIVEGFD